MSWSSLETSHAHGLIQASIRSASSQLRNASARASPLFRNPPHGLLKLRDKWRALRLTPRFGLAAAGMLLIGAATIGLSVGELIESGVTTGTVAAVALYMDSFVAPLVQDLATQDRLSAENAAKLDLFMKQTLLGRSVIAFKIRRRDGVIVFGSRPKRLGKIDDNIAVSKNFVRALNGTSSAVLERHLHEGEERNQATPGPLLAIYTPIREQNSGRIIAVSEVSTRAHALEADLTRATVSSSLVVGGVTTSIMLGLVWIFYRRRRTIDERRDRLRALAGELQDLLAQNRQLRERVERAPERTSEITAQFLRRVGADLHDGPAQLLVLALLRLHSVKKSLPPDRQVRTDPEDIEVIRAAIDHALTEVRHISAALASPQIEQAKFEHIIRMARRGHERGTDTATSVSNSTLPQEAPPRLESWLSRLQPETLNNARRLTSRFNLNNLRGVDVLDV